MPVTVVAHLQPVTVGWIEGLRNFPHSPKQRNKPGFLNQGVHAELVIRPVQRAQESLRRGVVVSGPFDAFLRDHLPQGVARSIGAFHHLEKARLIGKITRRRARFVALEILPIWKRKWCWRWRHRGAFALAGGGCQRVNAARVQVDCERAFSRPDHPEFGELLLHIGAPDVQRLARKSALYLERQRLRIFRLRRLDDHAVVLAARRFQCYQTAPFDQPAGAIQVLPARPRELRGMRRGPDGWRDFVVPRPGRVGAHDS